jgi:outer membrane protein insertion porin family
MVRFLKRGAALLFAATMFLMLPDGGQGVGPQPALAQVVQQVVVEGNRRVDAETIRNYMTIQPGQSYSERAASESLAALFATGLFADVRMQMRANQLVVTVQENPIINIVSFEGNRQINDSTLRQSVESEPRGVFTRATVQNDVVRILQLYRRAGRFGARVEPQVIELPENRVNLVFEIDEGDKTSVQRISFVGNQAFSDRNLRDVITTSERNWLSWLKTSDIYDPERLEADQELLRRHYLKNGYADFRVVSAVADFDRERNAFYITITVDEGAQYRVGNVEVESFVRDVDPETLRRLIRNSPGEVYNPEDVDKSLEDMTFALANQGYAFAQVRPRGVRDFQASTISLTYVVEEGPRVYVERIDIRGNTRTLDTVIRRELDFVEGDAYNAVLVERAQRRLERLRYFKSIDVTRERGSADLRLIATRMSSGRLNSGRYGRQRRLSRPESVTVRSHMWCSAVTSVTAFVCSRDHRAPIGRSATGRFGQPNLTRPRLQRYSRVTL